MGYKCLVILIAAAVTGMALPPQSGSLTGHVVDENGAAVPAANIEIINPATNDVRNTVTAADGNFAVPELPAGTYRIVIGKPGFRTVVQSNLEVQAGSTAALNYGMQAGDPAQHVEAAGVELSLSAENETGDTADEEEIEDTPLDGRDFQDLAFQTAGVLKKAAGGQGSNYAINGARSDNTSFLLDGFNNRNVKGGGQQIRVPIDAMQEFKMEVNTYSAEYGRYGGGVMNVVLRKGANQPHGAVFEFLRNDRIDARNFFAAEKDKLRRNQFGANATGPLYVPRVYDGRNRTFFLFTWESYRQRQGATQLTRVPTELERSGNFSQTFDVNGKMIALKDPLASGACNQPGQAACFPGSIVPQSRWNPVTAQVLKYYPLPNAAGVNNFAITKSDADNWDNYLGKLDHKLTQRNSLAVRYARRIAETTSPFAGSPFPMFGQQVHNRETLGGINLVTTITPTLTNDVRAGVVRTAQTTSSANNNTNFVQQLGIAGASADRQYWGFPRFTVRDLGAIGDPAANPAMFVINSWQFQDSAGYVRGRHAMRFGLEYMRSNYVQDATNNLRGTFNFLGRWTGAPLADFLLGLPNAATRQVGAYRNYLSNNTYAGFFQDGWRAGRNLSIDVGVRYEIYNPPSDKYGRWTNFSPELGKQVVSSTATLPDFAGAVQSAGLSGLVTTAQEAGLPGSLIYSNPHNMAPRVGIAWRPFGAARTVVRSGYGIFYTSMNLTQIRGDLGAAFPFLMKQTFNRNASKPDQLTMSNPFPDTMKAATDVSNTNGFEVRPRAAYLQSWNVSIDRELSPNAFLTVTYTGSKGTHLGRHYDVNQPFRSAAMVGNFPRPFSGWNNIQFYAFGSNSNYNGAVFTVRRQFSGGGMLRLNYTLAKSIDESSQITGAGDGGYGGAQDARHLFLERGRSDWDMRHAVSAAVNYPLPFLARHRWLGGWRISSTARIYSGQPFTPQTSNVQLDQGEADRPDRAAFGNLAHPTPDRWFDLSAFPVVPLGSYRFGNSGRNILNGPRMVQINAGLMKNFALTESTSLQFRVEAFNVPNHANFDLPNVNVNAVNGGTITSAKDARLLQAALKFLF